MRHGLSAVLLTFLLAVSETIPPTEAAEFSITELQWQYGRLKVPKFAGGGEDNTNILTVQHASGYKWGDFYGFIDFLKGENSDVNHFNDYDAYGEMYINFSSTKLLKINYGKGLLRDIGYVQGFNFDADANVYKILPGIRFSTTKKSSRTTKSKTATARTATKKTASKRTTTKKPKRASHKPRRTATKAGRSQKVRS